MRILHVLNGFGFGGAELWLLEIVKLNNGRHTIDFVLTGGVPLNLDQEFLKYDSKLFYLEYQSKKALQFAKEFRLIVKNGNYDVIHDHEDFVAGWHWLFLSFMRVGKKIAHAHNSMIYINNYRKGLVRKGFYYFGKALVGVLSTSITGTSNMLLDELGYNTSFFQKKRIEPLYCGTNLEHFKYEDSKRMKFRDELKLSTSAKLVLFIGRIGLSRKNEVNHKNPEFAFDVAVNCCKKDNDINFVFVGEKGELGEHFENKLAEIGLENRVVFLGKRTDVSTIMSACDLLLFTSTLEPFGLILAEAQFSRLPILASDIVTKEIVAAPDLFQFLNLKNDMLSVWESKVFSVLETTKGVDRSQSFQKDSSLLAFSVESSYERMLRNYMN